MKPASVPLKNLMDGNNYALQFDGTLKYVIANPPVNGLTQATLECWVKLAAIGPNTQTPIVIGNGSANGAWRIDVYNDGTLVGDFWLDGNVVSPVGAIAAGQLYHLVLTFDGVTKRIYKNGVLVNSAVSSATAVNLARAYIGSLVTGAAWNVNGIVDSCRVYSRALSTVEVLQHYQGVFLDDRGLVGRWELDENSGTTAYDWTGNANGTLAGSPAYVSGIAPLHGQSFVHADLYTWTLLDGTVARYTSADKDLTIGGNTFSSANALFQRDKTMSQLGVQVPGLDVVISPRAGDTIGGTAWLVAAMSGKLDGATVLVERFLADSWSSTGLGTLYQFYGIVGAIKLDRLNLTISLIAPTIALNQKTPRNVYQPTCLHTLYDGTNGVNGCARNGNTKASKTVSGTVGVGSTTQVIKTGRTDADNYFNLGVITFTSGANNGLTRAVDSYQNAGGTFNLPLALPAAPVNGDTFTAYPGCNKVYAGDCLNKFANQVNFRGMPFIPLVEVAA